MKKPEIKNKLFMVIYALLLVAVCAAVSDCTGKGSREMETQFPVMDQAQYTLSPDSFPFRFDVSDNAKFSAKKTKEGEYFCDLDYPSLQAHIYCTWHGITPERFLLMAEESHKLAYQHSLVATAIREKMYANDSLKVYGILYDIEGKAATPIQVALTDSVTYFFNASLYFNTVPNTDSIAPVLEYIRKDVVRMMETFTNNN